MNKPKINIIDISVILLVLILIFVATVKFRNYNETNEEGSKIDTIKYEIKISNVRNYTIDAFVIGDIVYDTATNVEIGKIINKNVTPAKGYEVMKNGKIIETQIPNKYDIILEVETPGLINDTGYFANRSVELKVGSEKTIETLYAKSTGIINKIIQSGDVE